MAAMPLTNSTSPTGFISPGAGIAVHRLTFDENRGDDVVAAAEVGKQVGQEIAAAVRRVPEVMMRIDDRQVRFQRRFGGPLRQPGLQVGIVAVDEPRYSPLESPIVAISISFADVSLNAA